MAFQNNLKPQVTGISPNQGVPGMKLTIRGSNFGESKSDIIAVLIGDVNVVKSLNFISSKHITVLTPLTYGDTLAITIFTEKGGEGTSTLTYNQQPGKISNSCEEVSYWPENERTLGPAVIERGKEPQNQVNFNIMQSMFNVNPFLQSLIPVTDSAVNVICPSLTNKSPNIADPNFHPVKFIVKYLKSSSLDHLLSFHKDFQSKLSSKENDQTLFAFKENLFTIFQALQQMDELAATMKNERQGKFGVQDGVLEHKLREAKELAYRLFQDVLTRKDHADAARSTLNVMDRFIFLFNLPQNIRANIQKGDTNMVINDYLKAKSHFGSTDIPAFQKVYEDVQTVIENFKLDLERRLLLIDTPLDEKKDLIRYLCSLEVTFEPAWRCLDHQKTFLMNRMNDILESIRAARAQDAEGDGQDSVHVPANIGTYALSNSVDSNGGVVGGGGGVGGVVATLSADIDIDAKPALVDALHSLYRIFDRYYADFWKLGCLYVAGQLKSSRESKMDATHLDELTRNLDDNERKSEWERLNLEIFHKFYSCVREMLLGNPKHDMAQLLTAGLTSEWIMHCVNEFRNCLFRFPNQDQYPALQRIFTDLSFQLRLLCIHTLLHKVEMEAANLHTKEDWSTELHDHESAITQLPIMFETIITDAFKKSQTYVNKKLSFEKKLTDAEEYCNKFRDWCTQTIHGFFSCLQHLALEVKEEFLEHTDFENERIFNGSLLSISKSRGYILLVNNCSHMIKVILPRINSLCYEYRLLPWDATVNAEQIDVFLQSNTLDNFMQQQKEMLDVYIQLKSEPIYGPLEQMIYSTNMNFKNAPIPRACSQYVGVVLNQLTSVYGEIGVLSPESAAICMEHCILTLLEELQRCLQACNHEKSWGHNAQFQLSLDLQVMESALKTHFNAEARSLMNVLFKSCNLRWTAEEIRLLENIHKSELNRLGSIVNCLKV